MGVKRETMAVTPKEWSCMVAGMTGNAVIERTTEVRTCMRMTGYAALETL